MRNGYQVSWTLDYDPSNPIMAATDSALALRVRSAILPPAEQPDMSTHERVVIGGREFHVAQSNTDCSSGADPTATAVFFEPTEAALYMYTVQVAPRPACSDGTMEEGVLEAVAGSIKAQEWWVGGPAPTEPDTCDEVNPIEREAAGCESEAS